MTSEERREGRCRRRKAAREAKRAEKLARFDNFERVSDADSLYAAFRGSMKGVSWKESVQRYEANAARNILETRRILLAGGNVQRGFVEFDVRERGKVRHIKSVHISERIVQVCLCAQALVPLLSHSLVRAHGASISGRGIHFALRRLFLHLSLFCRRALSNNGYALLIDFSKFFDNIDHEVLFGQLDKVIKDGRVRALTKDFIRVFGDGNR